jgi:hypothetical protein
MAKKLRSKQDININNTNTNNNNKIFIVKPFVIPFNQNFAKACFTKAFEKGFKVGITP